jgi:hypothetical protein
MTYSERLVLADLEIAESLDRHVRRITWMKFTCWFLAIACPQLESRKNGPHTCAMFLGRGEPTDCKVVKGDAVPCLMQDV